MNLVLTWIWLLEVFGFLVGAFSKKKRRMLNDEYGEYARKVRPQRTKKKRKEKKTRGFWPLGASSMVTNQSESKTALLT
jgi:hypothetical protein